MCDNSTFNWEITCKSGIGISKIIKKNNKVNFEYLLSLVYQNDVEYTNLTLNHFEIITFEFVLKILLSREWIIERLFIRLHWWYCDEAYL